MAIRNDDELEEAVDTVDEKLQEIQNYMGRKTLPMGKIRFPRGYIRTASHFRSYLSFINGSNLRKNISYTLILSDVFHWLINRTDIFGTAKEMIIKHSIVLAASLCESYCINTTAGIIGKNNGFIKRTNRMVAKEIIDSDLRDELHWLWGKRTSIHIYEIETMEHGVYKLEDNNRAVRAVHDLSNALEAYCKNK